MEPHSGVSPRPETMRTASSQGHLYAPASSSFSSSSSSPLFLIPAIQVMIQRQLRGGSGDGTTRIRITTPKLWAPRTISNISHIPHGVELVPSWTWERGDTNDNIVITLFLSAPNYYKITRIICQSAHTLLDRAVMLCICCPNYKNDKSRGTCPRD